jgi:hypothetical protein
MVGAGPETITDCEVSIKSGGNWSIARGLSGSATEKGLKCLRWGLMVIVVYGHLYSLGGCGLRPSPKLQIDELRKKRKSVNEAT